MRFFIVLALILMALGSLAEKTNGRKSLILPSNSRLRQIDLDELLNHQARYEQEDEDSLEGNIESDGGLSAVALKPDSSSGRLFFKKFFLLGKKQPQQPPQIFIISLPGLTSPTTSSTSPTSIPVNFTGTVTTTPIDGRNGDLLETDVEDMYDEEIENEKPESNRQQHTTYKLVKGKSTQKGLSFLVPSKYMRNYQNKRNTVVLNPSGTYNSANSKVKKYRLSNSGNGNVKRKRSRNPIRRFIIANK